MNYLILLLLLIINSSYANKELIYAAEIFRHGDRTPIHDNLIPHYDWPEGLGQLTPLGMKQHYELGKNLRELYVTKYHLIPEKYNKKYIYIRSDDVDRTLMSAFSFLQGLYPENTGPSNALPHKIQPIPIHTVSIEEDTLFQTKKIKANEYKPLYKKYVLNSKEWIDASEKYKLFFERLSEAFHQDIKNAEDAEKIVDAVYIRIIKNIPLPKNFTKKLYQKRY